MRPLRFLLARGDLGVAPKVLVVQSGAADHVPGVVGLVRASHPEAVVTVLLRRGLDELPEATRALPGVEYVENLGSKLQQVRALQSRRFDAVFVLYSNEPGYWKLKLAPFLLGAKAVFAVNEHLGYFPVSVRHAGRLTNHLRWRLGSRPEFAVPQLAAQLTRLATTPAKLAYLLAYEQAANARARLRGSKAAWKTKI